jgi:hypothetical protein
MVSVVGSRNAVVGPDEVSDAQLLFQTDLPPDIPIQLLTWLFRSTGVAKDNGKLQNGQKASSCSKIWVSGPGALTCQSWLSCA